MTTYLPLWAWSLLVLVMGVLVAFGGKIILSRLFHRFHLDRNLERWGVQDFLRKGGMPSHPSILLSQGFRTVTLLGTLLVFSSLLGLPVVPLFKARLSPMLPELALTAVILILGIPMVQFVANFTRTVARNAGSPYGGLLGRVLRVVGMVLVVLVALERWPVVRGILTPMLLILFAGLVLALAISFGLGCQDLARKYTEKLVSHLREKHRDERGDGLE